MKIAIIGAGLYGCYLASKFASMNTKVDLYEKNDGILEGAATNNQSRLHYGFHYPRSPDTILQTIEGSKIFKQEMSQCIFYPKKNYYAVHKDSEIDFESYLRVMDEFNLEYTHANPLDISLFANPIEIEGAINTNEGVIVLSELKKILFGSLHDAGVKVKTGVLVTNIDPGSGKVYIDHKLEASRSYDWIINTTYTNPNLGLSDAKKFDVKYELTGMVLLKNESLDNTCMTIMDGEFVSLYPRDHGAYTLSSVRYTPMKRFDSFEEFKMGSSAFLENSDFTMNIEQIIDDARKYIVSDVLVGIENQMWVAPKVKIKNDHNATRVSSFIHNGRVISVMCGKIDVIPLVFSQLKRVIM